MTQNNKEIERKWILNHFPDMSIGTTSYRAEQFYLHVSHDMEVRFATIALYPYGSTPPRYEATIKLGNGLSRVEIENEITANAYHSACLISQGLPITKVGQRFFHQGMSWFISEIDGGFIAAEVEFPNEELAKQFNLSDYGYLFIGEDFSGWTEVTGDNSHSMKNYWLDKNNLSSQNQLVRQSRTGSN